MLSRNYGSSSNNRYYDAVRDWKGIFSEKFRKYVLEKKLCCRERSADEGFIFLNMHQSQSTKSASLDDFDGMMRWLDYVWIGKECLIQIWKPIEIDDGRRVLLTTRDQPFLLGESRRNAPINEGLCFYRMAMSEIEYDVNGYGSMVGRVFQNQKVEITPDVGYYSLPDYPHREIALFCHIKGCMAIPLFDNNSVSPLGVIELVLLSDQILPCRRNFEDNMHLQYGRSLLDCCIGLCGQYVCKARSFGNALDEIKEVMEMVGRTCDLVFWHTWMLCKHCDSISTSDRVNHKLRDTHRKYLDPINDFSVAESMCILQKGEGVVCKAATLSHNLVYCEDVTKINITQYPLAHFARHYNLPACFAISLQSNLTGNQVYILEIFPSLNYVKETGWLVMFAEIIEVMRINFRTFKFASGEELDFVVQPINASSPEIYRRKRITWKIIYFAVLFVIRMRRFIDLRLTDENFINEAGDPMTGIETPFIDPLEDLREDMRGRPDIFLQSIGQSSTEETDKTSSRDTYYQETRFVSFTTVQSGSYITIKAKYGDDFIKFEHLDSSGIEAFKEQVSKRLKLEDGAFFVKYQDDEDDWILLTCDDDLRLWISSSIKLKKYTLNVSIMPIV